MKLCLLANATCIHTRRWAAHFSARGHEVVVLSLSAGEIPDVRVECVGPDPRKLGRVAYLLAVPAVRRAIRELKPDIVHAHYAGGYGLVGALTGFHPLVTSAWGSDVLLAPQSGLLMKWIIRMCVDRADLITSVADHMSDSMRALGISGRILTLTYGADRGVFRPRPENSWSSTGLIVSTRHLEPVYNLELLVEALPAVFAAAPSAKVVIIGEGEERKQLELRVRELDLEGRVQFAGRLKDTEIAEYLSRADVYVSTSLSDGNSISLHEAMVCGAFPVVTDIPANREWILDGRNGFLVDTEDPQVLAEKILVGLKHQELRYAAADWNWKLVCQKASWKSAMAEMEKEYFALARSSFNKA